MDQTAWSDVGLAEVLPKDGPYGDKEAREREALCLIRCAYVWGYIDSLKEENVILDPCLASKLLAVAIPVEK